MSLCQTCVGPSLFHGKSQVAHLLSVYIITLQKENVKA